MPTKRNHMRTDPNAIALAPSHRSEAIIGGGIQLGKPDIPNDD
jgi:hypothetical protein